MDNTSIALRIDKINRKAHTQARAKIDQAAIDDYREALAAGERLPPIEVYRQGANYYLADGWHRFYAADELGLEILPARIHRGNQQDALLHAAGANAKHGVRRTAADKRIAVEIVLRDKEGATWSDRRIAEHCHVAHSFVANVRKGLTSFDVQVDSSPPEPYPSESDTKPQRRVGRDGKKQAAKKEPKKLAEKPDRKPKAGREKTSPTQRKACKQLWGQFVRAMDAALCEDGETYTSVVAKEIETISAKMKGHWG